MPATRPSCLHASAPSPHAKNVLKLLKAMESQAAKNYAKTFSHLNPAVNAINTFALLSNKTFQIKHYKNLNMNVFYFCLKINDGYSPMWFVFGYWWYHTVDCDDLATLDEQLRSVLPSGCNLKYFFEWSNGFHHS